MLKRPITRCVNCVTLARCRRHTSIKVDCRITRTYQSMVYPVSQFKTFRALEATVQTISKINAPRNSLNAGTKYAFASLLSYFTSPNCPLAKRRAQTVPAGQAKDVHAPHACTRHVARRKPGTTVGFPYHEKQTVVSRRFPCLNPLTITV